MLLTRVGLRERKGRFLPADSLKMESMKTDSAVKEGPRKDSRVGSSASSELGHGKLRDFGKLALQEGPFEGYSLGSGGAWTPSTDTGCRLSLDSMSWILVRRELPSAVEMTLLARGNVDADARSSRSDTDVARAWADRVGRTEPLTRVLSALRRLGRPGWPVERGGRSAVTGAALPLEERRMPRPRVAGRSFCARSEETVRRGDSTVRFS